MKKPLTWDDSYCVHDPVIDSQHKHLFELTDELYKLLEKYTSLDKKSVASFLEMLINYALFHFSSEEDYMAFHKYPSLPDHKILHEEFANRITGLVNDYVSGKEIDMHGVYDFLSDWLVTHITKEDKAFRIYIENHPE